MNDQESHRHEAVMPEEVMQQTSAQGTTHQSEQRSTQESNARTKAEQAGYQPEYDRPGRRRSSDDRANAFNALAWLVEGATGLAEELRHSDLGLSEDFWVHVYAMRREGLLAARAAIDSLLEKTERESEEAKEQVKRAARRGGVPVE